MLPFLKEGFMLTQLETTLEGMDLGPLLGLWLQSSIIGVTMWALNIIMLPAFLLAMYERDGLPFEKVIRNIIRARFLRPGARLYQTQNLYAPFTLRGSVGKEDAIATSKKANTQARPRRKG